TMQRRRTWASNYLLQVRKTYNKDNEHRLFVWRYAHALTQVGDDTAIAELQADLDFKQLTSYEERWLRWILKHLQEQWKKTVEKWPPIWFPLEDSFFYERGSIRLEQEETIN